MGSACLRSCAAAAAGIGAAAFSGQSELAARAVLLFLGVYGAAAGTWALSTVATAGVWLSGIARKLLEVPAGTSAGWRTQARNAFLSRYRDKGRLSSLPEAMPVHIIMTDEAPLPGAARFALAEQTR